MQPPCSPKRNVHQSGCTQSKPAVLMDAAEANAVSAPTHVWLAARLLAHHLSSGAGSLFVPPTNSMSEEVVAYIEKHNQTALETALKKQPSNSYKALAECMDKLATGYSGSGWSPRKTVADDDDLVTKEGSPTELLRGDSREPATA